MAWYDHGGGCPCGLYKECDEACEHHPDNKLASSRASSALMALLRCSKAEKAAILRRLEQLMTKKEAA